MTINFPWHNFKDIQFNDGELLNFVTFNYHLKKIYDNGIYLNNNPRIDNATSGYGLTTLATSAEIISGVISNKSVTTSSFNNVLNNINLIALYLSTSAMNISDSVKCLYGEFDTLSGSSSPYVQEILFGDNAFTGAPLTFSISPICNSASLSSENINCYRYNGQNDNTDFSTISSLISDYIDSSNKAYIVYHNETNKISKIKWFAIGNRPIVSEPYDPFIPIPDPIAYTFLGTVDGSLSKSSNYSPAGIPTMYDTVLLTNTAVTAPNTGTLTCSTFTNNSGTILGGTYNCSVSGNNLGTIYYHPSLRTPPVFRGAIAGNNLIVSSGILSGNTTFIGSSGIFPGVVTNNATIANGTFDGVVYNNVTIDNGTYNAAISNIWGNINGGTFNNNVATGAYGDSWANSIRGGTFNGSVTMNTAVISGGSYNGVVTTVYNNNFIYSGTFNNIVNSNSGTKIYNGIFNNTVAAEGTFIYDGLFNSHINMASQQSGYPMYVYNGIFNDAVYTSITSDGICNIYSGIFNGTLSGNNTASIIYHPTSYTPPVFNGSIITGNKLTISSGILSGNTTFNGTSGVFAGAVTNNATIANGTFNGVVTTRYPASITTDTVLLSTKFYPVSSSGWNYPTNSGTITNADIYWLQADNDLGGTITNENYLGYL